MALNFPSSPTNGQQYDNFVFNGSTWVPAQTLPGGLPAGSIIQWGGATAPANWLLCDGSAVSRTSYASLFAAVGTVYGAGDGSTTFNLPDLRGRVPVGKNGGSFGSLGATGGAETVALSISEMPAHDHGGVTNTTGAHTHTVHETWSDANTTHNHGSSGGYVAQGQTIARGGTYDDPNVVVSNGNHSHTISAQGGGAAHNNLQPYQVVNYIIKATAASTPGDSELATRTQPVTLGGTGATSLSAGSYLKGNGTNAVAVQSGVPATDLTGIINTARLPTIPLANGGTGATTGAGLIPVIPTSVAVGSGSASVDAGGLVTFSGATSVSVNGCFTSAYLNYIILFNETAATAYADGNLRLRASGTDASNAYYRNGILNDATSVMGFNSSNDSNWGNALTTHPATVGHAHSRIEIRDPQRAKPTTYQNTSHAWSGTGSRFLTSGGFHTTPSSYDGFTIYLSSGNFGGTFKIYGYN